MNWFLVLLIGVAAVTATHVLRQLPAAIAQLGSELRDAASPLWAKDGFTRGFGRA